MLRRTVENRHDPPCRPPPAIVSEPLWATCIAYAESAYRPRPTVALVTVGGEATMTDAWWDAPAVLTAVQNGDAGTVVRLARRTKGATQRQTGDACGYSQSEISR